eukprot:CAMPEP_0206006840 /NCGR_PEP_ID=MMETSP1464-20131121/5410_1 /ASSEMBLY_ACC=CAM_ASM_001124 /TAXON_ID=119497 /ORGANISM="Exanthemachrysis gayraliae, Strain RCC1523" /LENGTH=42 /DNA_ID= /DNA_START= /DNA_END= /DNA_ORIENTATION=
MKAVRREAAGRRGRDSGALRRHAAGACRKCGMAGAGVCAALM